MNDKIKKITYVSLTIISIVLIFIPVCMLLIDIFKSNEIHFYEPIFTLSGILILLGLLFWKYSKYKLIFFLLMVIPYILLMLCIGFYFKIDIFGNYIFFTLLIFSLLILHYAFSIITTIVYLSRFNKE